ncbi:hypothetical protein NDI85_19645 [Halomicroarcula sp. S1AR25-4]|uniref:hypothetical protein n=1 Tax=Haloarcula sp. S1AR25-4 TaxID=2950538 RepID=UPI00287570A9|nr:hypothetical protein [Halomicroarcula sp. S1AR25-4]MDS0280002.1 hypothetical protein [Halomicroarcula sp. S1AR25-4]
MVDPTDREALIREFADTYDSASELSSWELVEQYQRVQEYAADHPRKGSAAVASALDLPRSRIRAWVDSDGRPDVVRGIHTADANDWFDLEWESTFGRHLTVLVAWVFSGGSINDAYRPAFAVTPRTQGFVEVALETMGTGSTVYRNDAENRATELVPAADASVLGRLLVALGAPLGPKTRERALSLPSFLTVAPEPIRLVFARTYVVNRATARDERPTTPLQLAEERHPAYRAEVRALFESLVDGGAVRGDAESYRLTESAANRLHKPPL